MDRETLIKRNAIHRLESAIELSNSMVHLRKEHAKAILELLKEREPKFVENVAQQISCTYSEMTDEDKAIRNKYLERMKQIEEEHHTKIVENILDVVENFEKRWN